MPEAVEDVFNEPEKEGPSSIQDLKRKMRLEGTVSRVELYGAFVDVGVGTDGGLVHISQLRSERVNRVSDVVKQGDHVTVWVLSSDPSKRRIELTMIEPPAVDWDEVRSGQVYSGTVKRLERFGAFVDIGAIARWTRAHQRDHFGFHPRPRLGLVQTKAAALWELQGLFQQHPDALIFASLPGAGELLAPALLAQFGDDRGRFPTPASVQALAGTCPVTDASGKKRIIKFRKACDREFRTIAQQWAKASLAVSPWANAYWQQARSRCDSDSHAYRCLANRWLAIAWKLWQTRQPYDEGFHLQQRARHSQPRV